MKSINPDILKNVIKKSEMNHKEFSIPTGRQEKRNIRIIIEGK